LTAATTPQRPSIFQRFCLPRRCVLGLLWICIAAFLVAGGNWAFTAGMSLRQQLWEESGTIRYHSDISLAFVWGNNVLRYAERRAKLPFRADALADNPKAAEDPDLNRIPPRRLTNAELLDGWVNYYGSVVERSSEGQFELDYPPMRLALMTLWVRHAQRQHPALKHWPEPRNYDTPPPIAIYDFAKPLLLINAGCAAAAALAAGALCWLWTVRQHRFRRRHFNAAAASIIPHGLPTFLVATAAFWYAWSLAAQPPPPPTPRICLQAPAVDGHQMQLRGIVDAEGIEYTRWRFQWGATTDYPNATPWRPLVGALDTPRSVTRSLIQSSQEPFHYRLQARNLNGITSTDDQTYDPAALPADQPSPPVAMTEPIFGGFAIAGVSAWLSLLLLLMVMLVSARMLPPAHRGWACGVVAAMFVWFDPMILVDSHIWPQWDVWLLAFFIWAALAASLGAWEIAGLLLGIGAMFKGQMLMGVPILTLWPLFAGKPIAALRVLIGLACGAAVIVWPWMFNDPIMPQWTAGLIVAALLIGVWMALAGKWAWYTLPIFLTALAILVVWPFGGLAVWLVSFLIFAAALIGWKCWLSRPAARATSRLARCFRPIHIAGTLAMAAFTAGVFIAGRFYNGDFSWYKVGFVYGSVKQYKMAMGIGSFANLPALLKNKFGWQLDDVVGTINLPMSDSLRHLLGFPADGLELPLRTLLIGLNALCVVAAAAAAAVHSRRRDPRILAALCVPWMVMPICLGQMSERYLLWACALSSMLLCISAGWGLFHVLLTLLAAGMTLHQLLEYDPGRWPHLFHCFNAFYNDGSILMMLLVVILLAGALIPGRRKDTLC